jgi:hypothetical protein
MAFDGNIRRTGAALLLTCGLGLAACGGFVESGGGVARLTVGTEGGTLALDGFALVVPPHALGETRTLSAHRASTDAPAGPAFVVEPADVAFDAVAPAEVALAYDGVLHPHAAEVFVAVSTAGGWHVLAAPPAHTPTLGSAHGLTATGGTFGVVECPGGVCPAIVTDAGVAADAP